MVTIAIASSFLIVPKIRQQQKDNDAVNRQTREAITGIRVINAFDSLDFHADKFNKKSNSLKKNSFKVNGLNAINGPATVFITSCLTIGIY
jgi:ABC-type bacteriocin/lantibiotic exporter with double-glycine peptidase domain